MDKRAWDWPREAPARRASCGGLCQAISARKRRLAGTAIAVLGFLGAVSNVQPPRYNAEALVQTGPRLGGLIGLRSSAANANATGGFGSALGRARLLASRDLARKVIKELAIEDDREFDPGANGLGFGSRALVFLGLKRDPARKSRDDRVLEAFQERLRVSGPDSRGLLTIAFQSENPELAARAANRLAELYVYMPTAVQTGLPQKAAARVVAFAAPPLYPVPGNSLLLVTGTAIAALALGAIATFVLPRLPLRGRFDASVVQPHSLGGVRTFDRVKLSERLGQRIQARSDSPLPAGDGPDLEDRENGQLVAGAVARITSQREHVRRGIRIVVPQPIAGNAEPYLAAGLAKELARKGRTIAICLDDRSFSHFRGADAGPYFGALPGAEPLLRGLIAGRASFTEAICRDPCSRLHLLPLGQSGEFDFHELQKIIDALAETYDFIVTMAPPINGNDTAKILAQKSDFALLETSTCVDGSYLAAEEKVIESCSGEVLLLGLEKVGQSLTRSAA
jgi:Mrp family chromosome partitioning ATPase